jgi:hypothetical protein
MYETGARSRMTELPHMVETLGIVAGAASHWARITEERVAAVTVERQELVAAASDDSLHADLVDQFSVVLEAGKIASRAGELIPKRERLPLKEPKLRL